LPCGEVQITSPKRSEVTHHATSTVKRQRACAARLRQDVRLLWRLAPDRRSDALQAKGFDRYTNKSALARKLKSVLGVTPFNNQAQRGWAFPSLAECRALWERRNGGHWHWHRELSEWGKGS
jgi:hypothetical protein